MKKKQKNFKSKIWHMRTILTILLGIIILLMVNISYIKISSSTVQSVTPTTQPTGYSRTNYPTVILTPTVSSEVPSYFTPLQITSTQSSCPTGFLFYENEQYSICYPSGFFAYSDTDVQGGPNNQPQQNVVTFSSTKNPYAGESFWVIPVQEGSGGGQCRLYEKLTLSGYQAQRETQRDILPNGICGSITSIATNINTGQYYPFGIYYESSNNPRFIQDYPVFEQSLKIKYP